MVGSFVVVWSILMIESPRKLKWSYNGGGLGNRNTKHTPKLTILHHQTRSRRDMDYHNNQHAVVYHQRLPPYFPSPHTTPIPSSLSPSLPSFPRLSSLLHCLLLLFVIYFHIIFSPRLDSDHNYRLHAYIP